jgi:DNA repair exonuclease SbcCD ATPase subunit
MSTTQIIECAPCYDLKYDETNENLRDQTLQELRITYGRDSKIKCNCWIDRAREYNIDSAFISAHMKSKKHRNWCEEQQKEHKKNYGHCISSEKIIETKSKELRDYKKLHVQSIEIINKKDEKLVLLSTKLDSISDENDILKDEFNKAQSRNNELELEIKQFRQINDDLKKKNNEVEDSNLESQGLKAELEEYQIDIIALTKEKDQVKYELNKLIAINKKKASTKIEGRQVFR